MPAFQRDGKFDEALYRRQLEYERLTPAEFEQNFRRDFLKQLFVSVLTENIIVSRQELEAAFHRISDTYELNWLVVDPAQFSKDVQVGDDEASSFFEANKARYRVPPRITLKVIDFPASAYMAQTEVTPEDARDYYEGHTSEFCEPARVKVRRILGKVPEGARGQEISQKEELARKILAEANAGKDFTALARQYSEEEATAQKGGDIGMVPVHSLHSELAEAVGAMKSGEVKGPVRSAAGFEILKLEAREEEKAIPFENVSSTVMDTLRLQRAKIIAHAEAKKAFMELYEQKTLDLEGYAKTRGLAVRKVGPFSEGQDAGVSMSPEALKKAFAFSAGELGDVVGTQEGYFIYAVEGKELSRIPDLKEVAGSVMADAATDAALKKAREHARRLAETPAEKLGALSPSDTGEFTRSDHVVPKLSMIPKLMDDLDALSTPRTYEARGAVYVVWLKSRKIADIGMLDGKKAQEIKDGLLAAKREAALKSYLEQARDEKKGWHKVVTERDRIGGGDADGHRNVPPPMDFN